MRYEALMLTKTQFESYQLFETLSKLPKKKYPIRDLGSVTNSSNAKIKYALERIADILEDDDPEQAALFRESKSLDLAAVTVSLSDFRFTLLNNHSLAFQFLLWILTKEDASIESFLEANFVSQSTLNRAVRGLQRYLHTYDIQISLTNFLIESGDELMLRQSLFYLLWLATKGETRVFEPYVIDDEALELLVQQTPKEHRYIERKLYRLKLIIQYFRVKKGHYLASHPRLESYFDGDEFRLPITQPTELIPVEYQRSEGVSLLANLVASPLVVAFDEEYLQQRYQLHQRVAPEFLALAEAFLHYFELNIFRFSIPTEERSILKLNLAQAASGIWIYHGTFPNLHYFLVQENHSQANLHYQAEIRGFFQSESANPFISHRSFFSTFEKSFAHILQPFYVSVMEWTHLRVAVAVEPNSILYDKLRMVLNSIYFVDFHFFQEELIETYDVVVTSIGCVQREFAEVECYVWNIAEEDEDLPFLFYRLKDVFYQKNSKLRFI